MGNAKQIKMGYIKKKKKVYKQNMWGYTIPVCNVSVPVHI